MLQGQISIDFVRNLRTLFGRDPPHTMKLIINFYCRAYLIASRGQVYISITIYVGGATLGVGQWKLMRTCSLHGVSHGLGICDVLPYPARQTGGRHCFTCLMEDKTESQNPKGTGAKLLIIAHLMI